MLKYSEKYTDGTYEYRHVSFEDESLIYALKHNMRDKTEYRDIYDVLHRARIRRQGLSEEEWRYDLKIEQSRGWENYAVFPCNPHVVLFRRPVGCNGSTGRAPEGWTPHENETNPWMYTGYKDSKRAYCNCNNNLKDFPIELHKMIAAAKLTDIDVSDNDIEVLPPSISKLRMLEFFTATNNLISYVPQELASLAQLRYLNLAKNRLKHFGSIGSICNLEVLILEENFIKSIPNNIGNLVNLSCLDLKHNEIEKLPESIQYLYNLKDLHLSNNNLHNMPDQIGKLTNLEKLSLDQNEINILPQSLTELENLKFLALDHNNLRRIPDILNLPKIEAVLLQKNLLNRKTIRMPSREIYVQFDPQKVNSRQILSEIQI